MCVFVCASFDRFIQAITLKISMNIIAIGTEYCVDNLSVKYESGPFFARQIYFHAIHL